jgi:PAS domain S-box-containing protein
LELYLLFVGSVLLGAYVFYSVASDRAQSDVEADDLALARSLAEEVDKALLGGTANLEELSSLLALIATDRAGMIVVADNGGNPILYQSEAIGSEPIWTGWLNRTAGTARNANGGTFVTTAPDGADWFHAYHTTPDANWRVIVQRPSRPVSSVIQDFQQALLVAAIIYVTGGVVFWFVLSHQLITPLEGLEVFSGLVRWRGRAHPEEEAHLKRLSRRADQVGSLSRTLMAMAQDIEDRFVQLSTLLETSRIVAASLDLSEVSDNILEQVQRLFHVERSAIVALDKRAGQFRMRASRGLSKQYVSQLRIDPAHPNSPSMRSLRNKTPIQVSDTENDLAFTQFRARAREEGYRSVLAIPLLTVHAPPAALILYKSEPHRYGYSELELASSFANHATIAMENAALHAASDERLQEQTRRLEAIVESMEDGLILESLDGQVMYCNRVASEMLGLSHGRAQGLPSRELLDQLLATTVNPETPRTIGETVIQGQRPRSFDLERTDMNGRPQDLRVHLFDVTDARGDLIGRGQLWLDITSDKDLDRMKSTLLSTVSHELRTPLAAIKGYVTTLLAQDVEWDAEAQRQFLQTISDETDRLAKLVKDLLDMSRIEAGTLQMQREPYSVTALIRQAVRQVRPPCDARLELRISGDLPAVWVDVARIETVVRNFLENAVKYSPPDTPIELEAQQQNGNVVVQVRDYGAGVPEVMHDKVFDRFFRVDNRLTRHTGGVGMGLAICKGFIEAHGGQVWVTDGEPGSVFGFSIPIEYDLYKENPGR